MKPLSDYKTIHFIGIGGAGMSPIAKLLLEKKITVTGSDLKESANTVRLKNMGASVYYSHKAENLRLADLVVVSTAISLSNEEYQAAVQTNLPILRRAELLDVLMMGSRKRVAIAGTHGKTTTTGMVTRMLQSLHCDPTYIIGSELADFGGNAALGKEDYCVAESDESDGTFLTLHPNVGIITNIEAEHMNYFKTFENLLTHFKTFCDAIFERGGYVICNGDDAHVRSIVSNTDQTVFFAIDSKADISAKDIRFSPSGTQFQLVLENRPDTTVHLAGFGKHHVYNALATIAFGLKEGFSVSDIVQGVSLFKGTKRRFQLIGTANDIHVYDDYGHHPTEIKTTLGGIKKCLQGRLICVFQPHRYTRTKDLIQEFGQCFGAADHVVLTEIYAANEEKMEGVSSQAIAEAMPAGSSVEFIAQKSKIADKLVPQLEPGDLVVTMGAGDIYTVGKELLSRLKKEMPDH